MRHFVRYRTGLVLIYPFIHSCMTFNLGRLLQLYALICLDASQIMFLHKRKISDIYICNRFSTHFFLVEKDTLQLFGQKKEKQKWFKWCGLEKESTKFSGLKRNLLCSVSRELNELDKCRKCVYIDVGY